MELHSHVSLVATVPVIAVPGPAEPQGAPQPVEAALVFTGRGGEYFRIWVVNTLLTLLTLGIYSAWAKVRRTRYLWQNTRLDGFAFDYHARPIAILRGRILAFALFGAYTYAFDFSRHVGLAVVLVLCAVGPWLFMRAQQFKLLNSSWRGLRFGFEARTAEAFRVVLPILLLWFLGTFVAVLAADERETLENVQRAALAQLPAAFAIPWMHQRLKAYQHGRASYGDRAFSFRPATLRFYGVYLKAGLLVVLVMAVATLVAGAAMGVSVGVLGLQFDPADPFPLFMFVLPALVLLVTFVLGWPYMATRLQQATWTATQLGDVRFHTEIRARTLARLTLKNVLLTLVTLGLYWPFASIQLAKYRIECMRVQALAPFGQIAAGTHAGKVGAGGEGAMDAFGLDLGL
jgi:uncharacterized membrane protein YjgN (DUF898 family)